MAPKQNGKGQKEIREMPGEEFEAKPRETTAEVYRDPLY